MDDKTTYPIDFVVLWVDDTDLVWQTKREKTLGIKATAGNESARYRDWGTLKYWFRGVEKFAPWVNNIYFVTDNQKPEWLNLNHPKLKWIKHTDYIPEEYLPTFNSNVIELNLHRIPGLAEHFVNFNDDMFLIKQTEPKDFFIDGLPCDWASIGPIPPTDFFAYTKFNNAQLINRNFSLRDSIKANFKKWIGCRPISEWLKLLLYGRKRYLVGLDAKHIHICVNKNTLNTVWKKEYETLDLACRNKKRSRFDISIWAIRDWQILSGEFYPKKPSGKLFHLDSLKHCDEAIHYLRNQKGKVVCLNDTENVDDFELRQKKILEEFEKLMPEKSAFEI